MIKVFISNDSQIKCNLLFLLPLGGAITRPLQDVTVAESQTAQLECEVANARSEGRWLKEGQPVDFSDNVVSEVDGAIRRLLIIITRPQDVGEYTYQVANSKTTANLRVEGRLYLFIYLYIFIYLLFYCFIYLCVHTCYTEIHEQYTICQLLCW